MSTPTGIIGGSGLYSLLDPETARTVPVETPFGPPSDAFTLGTLEGREVVFLPRHGRNHSLLPFEVNYRANIYAMKALGVERIISISAVGSLKEEYRPRDVVVVDQFFDRTMKRPQTFFGDGFVAHVGLGDPVCPAMRRRILETTRHMEGRFHEKGTYVNMEGPQFSTRAESLFYRAQGFDVIGMTNLSEARLAREAEICYASLAFVTDYDCWKADEDAVTTDEVLQVLRDNAENARRIVSAVLKDIPDTPFDCTCREALKTAMVTPPGAVPDAAKTRLHEILKKYL
jgi:5'-methylthioadenosine phosphorylase